MCFYCFGFVLAVTGFVGDLVGYCFLTGRLLVVQVLMILGVICLDILVVLLDFEFCSVLRV